MWKPSNIAKIKTEGERNKRVHIRQHNGVLNKLDTLLVSNLSERLGCSDVTLFPLLELKNLCEYNVIITNANAGQNNKMNSHMIN